MKPKAESDQNVFRSEKQKVVWDLNGSSQEISHVYDGQKVSILWIMYERVEANKKLIAHLKILLKQRDDIVACCFYEWIWRE